jgi:hypothetical protein
MACFVPRDFVHTRPPAPITATPGPHLFSDRASARSIARSLDRRADQLSRMDTSKCISEEGFFFGPFVFWWMSTSSGFLSLASPIITPVQFLHSVPTLKSPKDLAAIWCFRRPGSKSLLVLSLTWDLLSSCTCCMYEKLDVMY